MKIKKGMLINLGIILLIILIAILIILKPYAYVDKKIAKCIGQNSELYIQLGCHACLIQEKIFGENYQYLNVTDCWSNGHKCSEILVTPTWIINGEQYADVRSIEELKELTKC